MKRGENMKLENINIRATAEEKKAIQEAAAQEHRTVSNYLLRLALDDIAAKAKAAQQ